MREIALMIFCVACGGFFSASETGFYCLNLLRLRLRLERGEPSARVLHWLAANPRRMISTVLVGTNLAVYLTTVLCTQMLFSAGLGSRAQFYAGFLMPPVLLVFADMIPKSLMQRHADSAMYRAAWPLAAVQVLFYPLSALLRAASALPHLLFGRRASTRPPVLTDASFRHYLREGAEQGVLTGFQRSAAMNIMRLKSLDVAEAMTPLGKVVMIGQDASADELLGLLGAHRYSRVPVHGERRETILGVINVIDVAALEGELPCISSLARDPLRLRRGTSVADALRVMRAQRQQFAIVVDQDETAFGIVSIKDLVEEIVGELDAW